MADQTGSRVDLARLRAVFAQLVDLPPAERLERLDDLCGDGLSGEGLPRAVLVDLLRHHDAAPAFLSANEHAVARPYPAAFRPKQLGPYRVLDLLGQGGMGMVFLAQQERPNRRVALKVLPPAAVRADSRQRFVQEAELLGRLQHVGIAQIYDAGVYPSEAGEVACYAMEWVAGVPLATLCRERALDAASRCALLAQVCDAVQHAHERGVVHRDLKPANILVVEHTGGQVQPKVLDFGIARAIDGEQDATRLTRTGQMIGTLAYMSPEQVRGVGEVDARSDVYALGVILYELLSDRLPVAVDGVPLAEAARAIGEDETTRLSVHVPTLRGDLDTIVATALAKEPARRYPSAAALAADLRRFLRHEPITAQPATTLYRLRKFVRRHFVLVAGALATMLALAIGLAATTVLALENGALLQRESAARRAADENLYRAEMVLAGNAVLDPAGSANTRELLGHWRKPGETDLRGFEWFLLDSLSHQSAAPLAAPLRVENCDWHPSRPWVAVAAHAEVRVFDIAARRELFEHSYGRHVDVHWSPDGALLLVGSTSGLEVLRASDFEPLHRVPLTVRKGVSATGWSPDGARVAVTFFDRSVAVYDWRTGVELVSRPDLATGRQVAFSPDGARLAVPSGHRVDVVDAATLQTVLTTRQVGTTVSALAWRPDGEELLLGHGDGTVSVCSARDGAERDRLQAADTRAAVTRVAWDARGALVAATAVDFSVRVWDRRAPHVVRVLPGHTGDVLGLAWGGQGQLATGASDGELRIWDLGVSAPHRTLLRAGRRGRWMSLRWHPDGRRLAFNYNTSSRWLDVTAGPEQASAEFDGGQGSFSPDGAWFMFERDQRVVLRDLAGAERIFGERANQSIAWDPTRPAAVIFVRTGPPELRVVDVASGVTVLEVSLDAIPVVALAFSRDGSRVALLCDAGRVEVRELADGKLLGVRTLPSAVRMTEAAFSPDGRELVVACWDGKLRRFDVDGHGEIHEFGATRRPLLGVAWHPTAPRIASVGEDRVCRLWDADANALVIALPTSSELEAVSWRPDGKLLAVGRRDGVLEVWDATVGYEREGR